MAGPAYLDLPAATRAEGVLRLPGSKSLSNRTLLIAALAEGTTEVRDLLTSDDTGHMLDALVKLGVKLERHGASDDYRVEGLGDAFPVKRADLFLGNAGTAVRPLTAALALSQGEYHLSGVPRMHERPIGDLVDALREAGTVIDYEGTTGFPPLAIRPGAARLGARMRVKGNVSSQYLTALLLALPLLSRRAGTAAEVEVVGELISKPYIEMTLAAMAQFGVVVEREGWSRFRVPAGTWYRSPGTVFVEGDASSASYFLAAGAIAGGPVRVTGVGRTSVQGDVQFADALRSLGAQVTMGENWIEARAPASGRLRAFDLDLNQIPDAAMTLAICALFADGPCRLRNIASWRVKETDRIAAMAAELRKVGATVEEGSDFLVVTPPHAREGMKGPLPLHGLTPHATIDTYDDHRMAMCFALVALGGVPVRINDPACVNKTFPEFFARFAQVVRA